MSNDPNDSKLNEKKYMLDQYQRQPNMQQYFTQPQQQVPNYQQHQLLQQQQQILNQMTQMTTQPIVTYSGNEWTSEEMALLHEGLKKYPETKYDDLTRAQNIGKMIETKSIRDISNQIKVLQQLQKKRKSITLEEPQLKKQVKKEEKPNQQEQEAYINQILLQNNNIINSIRENILKGTIENNYDLISQFRNNIIQVLTCMSKMPGVMSQMPPIPVKLNTICVPQQKKN